MHILYTIVLKHEHAGCDTKRKMILDTANKVSLIQRRSNKVRRPFNCSSDALI